MKTTTYEPISKLIILYFRLLEKYKIHVLFFARSKFLRRRKKNKLILKISYQMLGIRKLLQLFSLGNLPRIRPVFYILFGIIISKNNCYTQENLVPNGSFEEYDSCPQYLNSIGDPMLATNWMIPTEASSDYYNTCSTQEVGVPQNILGYQYAKDGKGYAGLITWSVTPIPAQSYREYFAVKLKKQLIANKKYFLCFWISRADSVGFATNNIGIAFSSEYSYSHTTQELNMNVYFNCDSVIFTSNKWVKLNGSFIANGNEKYLYIGNFYNDKNTIIKEVDSNALANDIAYYYIDNIYLGVKPCIKPTVRIPNVFTPNNDGVNDYYRLSYQGIDNARVNIYNRWGNVVFNGNINDQWDGNHNGKPCSEGVYFVIIDYFDYSQQKEIQKTGFIHLMR